MLSKFQFLLKFWQQSHFWPKIEIFTKYRNFGHQKSEVWQQLHFWPKIKKFTKKNVICAKKSELGQKKSKKIEKNRKKIEKNRKKIVKKSKCLQNSKFWLKMEVLTKNLNMGPII